MFACLGISNFEKARDEIEDASLPSQLWHKVGDGDVLSVGVEGTELAGLACCLIGVKSVRGQKEVEDKSQGSE